jgi:RsiW-degrading membrane proteinase PrsW (M82 family)
MAGLTLENVWSGGAAAIVGGALLWIVYFDAKDRLDREPRHLLALAFVLGIGAGALGLVGFALAESLGLPRSPGEDRTGILLYCLLAVGPIEEGAKFLVARAVVFRWKAFDEPIDGLVYAAALAIGFATFESFLYLPHTDGVAQLARAATAPLTHALFAGIWGIGASRALLAPRSRTTRFAWQAGTLALAMGLHGLYDALLLGWGATVLASGTVGVVWIGALAWVARVVRRMEGRLRQA